MSIKNRLLISILFLSILLRAQTVSHVYKIEQLINRASNKDTTYILNFWATWCKPCVQELPAFDSLETNLKKQPVKILLVCLDFKEDLEKKVNPFLAKHKINIECVLLDEINGNDFINKIDDKWTGAIPATLFKRGDQKKLSEKKMHLSELEKYLKEIREK